jgi:4-hydroxybenzoate polyprenyltransferase
MIPAPRTSQGRAILDLINPPLVIAAAAECLAGACLAGASLRGPVPYLLALASALMFGAGAIFGHYFDAAADAREHPQRPLPSGRVPPAAAWLWGWALLAPGAALPGIAAGRDAALFGVMTAVLVVLYPALTRGQWGAGFLTLGLARAANLLLGITAGEFGIARFWPAAIPVALYGIGWAVLRASRQRGAPPGTGFVGLLHLAAALSALLYLSATRFPYRIDSLSFLIGLLALTLPRFVNAVLDGRRPQVLEAVQFGFLGLTLLEAALAAGYSGFAAGALVAVFCLPVLAALKRWRISLAKDPG